jgi:hypothetical protein
MWVLAAALLVGVVRAIDIYRERRDEGDRLAERIGC